MSTVAEVVDRSGRLVRDVRELLQTDTVSGLLEAASALGAQQAVQDGFTALQTGLGKVDQGLAPVIRTLIEIDAAAGVFGIVPPVVDGIGLLISGGGEFFAELVPGLGEARHLGEIAGEAMGAAGREIGAASQFVDDTLAFVDPASFRRLRADLIQLSAALEALKKQATAPPRTGVSSPAGIAGATPPQATPATPPRGATAPASLTTTASTQQTTAAPPRTG